MKPFAIVFLAAAALAASPARADHDSRGSVSGAIVISAPTPVYAPAAYPSTPAYYPPAPVRNERGHGYWTDTVVKSWVPEHWTEGRDRWGPAVRYREPAHFIYRTERVWVDGRRGIDYRDDHRYEYDRRDGEGYRR